MTDFTTVSRSISALHSVQENWSAHAQRQLVLLMSRGQPTIVVGCGKSKRIGELGADLLRTMGVDAHATDSMDLFHGGLGLTVRRPLFILISNSGETVEITSIGRTVKAWGLPLAVICGHPQSTLAQMADILFTYDVPKDGSRHGTIPAASLVAQLTIFTTVVCDIANAGTVDQLQQYHPGGTLYPKEST
jgi:D-arabinose 5-phosphate isomerase GutQ